MIDNYNELYVLEQQIKYIIDGNYSHRLNSNSSICIAINNLVEKLEEVVQVELNQHKILEENNALIQAFIANSTDRVIVTDIATNQVLHTNSSDLVNTRNACTNKYSCSCNCKLFEYLDSIDFGEKSILEFEYHCSFINKSYYAKSYNAHWQGIPAYIHIIKTKNDNEDEEKLHEMLYTDELTGLYNRRFGMDTLESFMKTNIKFTFCMIDIDSLKFANDSFGHAKGDVYLRIVAKELLDVFSNQDVICRLGGDEFAIISETESENSISAKLEVVNQKLSSYEEQFPMAISFGSVSISDKHDISSLTLMHIADKKMYAHKNTKKI